MAGRPILIVTRPKPLADEFAETLHDADVELVVSPMLDLRATGDVGCLPPDLPLIFSSRTALMIADAQAELSGHSAYVVGDRTGAEAARLGVELLGQAETAEELSKKILADQPQKLLHLGGDKTAWPLAETLISNGIETEYRVIYHQVALTLSEQAHACFRGERPVLLPLFSPRSAAILLKEVEQIHGSAPLHLIAISAAALAPWDDIGCASKVIAERPNAIEMRQKILDQIAAIG